MFTPPQGFSQLTAPFIASWSQGIRLVPVLLDFCQVCEDTSEVLSNATENSGFALNQILLSKIV